MVLSLVTSEVPEGNFGGYFWAARLGYFWAWLGKSRQVGGDGQIRAAGI